MSQGSSHQLTQWPKGPKNYTSLFVEGGRQSLTTGYPLLPADQPEQDILKLMKPAMDWSAKYRQGVDQSWNDLY